MGEAMLRHELSLKGCSGFEVASAGTWAGRGDPPTPLVLSTLERAGISSDDLRGSSPLTLEDVAAADLVVAMTSVHLAEIEERARGTAAKVRLAKELDELGPPAGPSAKEKLDSLLRTPRPEPRRDLDLDDPIGLPASAYDRVYRQLRPAVEVISDLC
jgi:protein-tyrosine-phosphatase